MIYYFCAKLTDVVQTHMSDAPNAMENIENCNDPEDKSDGEINDSSLHLLHPEDRAENNEIELNHCVNSVLDFTL